MELNLCKVNIHAFCQQVTTGKDISNPQSDFFQFTFTQEDTVI